MKKTTIGISYFLDCTIATGQTWTKEVDFMGTARYYAATFTIGQYGYIGGGIEGKGCVGLGRTASSNCTDLWRYDTASKNWTQMASLPSADRYNASVFVIGFRAYVIGGSYGGSPYSNKVWMSNAHTNKWTQMNTSPQSAVSEATAFSVGNHGYFGCGWTGSMVLNTVWEYDTTNDTWSSLAASPVNLAGTPGVFVIRNKTSSAQGMNGTMIDIGAGLNYDTVARTWSTFTNLGTYGLERAIACGFSIGGYGNIGVVQDSNGTMLKSFWQNTPVDNSVSELKSSPIANSVYPKPSSGIIHFTDSGMPTSDLVMNILDVSERIIKTILVANPNGELNLNLSDLMRECISISEPTAKIF